MRGIVLALALVGLVASPADALPVEEARHLLSRTGFGASVAEVRSLARDSREQAVDRLLAGIRTMPSVPPPAWLAEPRPDWRAFYASRDEIVRRDFNRARDREANELRAWWYQEMVSTPSPLTERLVLFWHNHFTSSHDKVRHTDLMMRQNQLFRTQAAGDYRALVHAIAIDPAMLRYLDGNTSRRTRPNENFARELLELFTLGEGNYTEADIKEAARAFTGWWIDEPTGDARLARNNHDEGEKRLFGQTIPAGPGSHMAVVELALAQPAAAPFVVRKLWQEFVSPDPDPAAVARLAAILRRDWQLKPVLRALLLEPAFWDEDNRGALVKSPVDLLVGTIRSFDLVMPAPDTLVNLGRQLGQDLFNPPNVRGWPGHTAWIGTQTLLVRRDALLRLARGEGVIPAQADGGMMGGGMMGGAMGSTPASSAPQRRIGRAVGVQGWTDLHKDWEATGDQPLMLALRPVEPPVPNQARVARIERLLLDPAYQVK
jgi:uncharacterized protein (DUF1800 family)